MNFSFQSPVKKAEELFTRKIIKENKGLFKNNRQYFDESSDQSESVKITNHDGSDILSKMMTPSEVFNTLMSLDVKNFHAFYLLNHKVLPQELTRVIFSGRFVIFSEEMESVLLAVIGAFAKNFQEYNTTGNITGTDHRWWTPYEDFDMAAVIKGLEYDEDWKSFYNNNKEYFSTLETEVLKITQGTLTKFLDENDPTDLFVGTQYCYSRDTQYCYTRVTQCYEPASPAGLAGRIANLHKKLLQQEKENRQ